MACRDIDTIRGSLRGSLRVPGDKSIAQRAILLAAAAEGESHITGLADSLDVASALEAVALLGAQVEREDEGAVAIEGWGVQGPQLAQGTIIDCGNTATLARSLTGLLAGYPGDFALTGDESLRSRPMRRVLDPLARMGAQADSDALPLVLSGTDSLHAIDFTMEVASAQVKSAILFAGLHAAGTTHIVEPKVTRAHAEALLPLFGVSVESEPCEEGMCISIEGQQSLTAASVDIPADPSSAAFPAALAMLVPGSSITLRDINLDPARTGFYRALERMGARITIEPTGSRAGQPCGDISVAYTDALVPVAITPEEAPSLIDELPILMLLAAFAEGVSAFDGIGELRVKETDRLAAMCAGFVKLGVRYDVSDDSIRIDGGFTSPSDRILFESFGDHRMALTWTVLGLSGVVSASVADFDSIKVSYPQFLTDMEGLSS